MRNKTKFQKSKLARTAFVAVAVTAVGVAADLSLPPDGIRMTVRDKEGRILSRTTGAGSIVFHRYDAKGRPVDLSYHPQGRLSGIPYVATDRIRYTYNAAGMRATMTDARGTIRYEYDDLHRLVKILAPEGHSLSFDYDPWGHVIEIGVPDGARLRYSYDVLGELTAVSDGQLTVTYERHPEQSKIVRRLPNGVASEYSYDPRHRVASIRHLNKDGSLIAAFHYQYDDQDRVIEMGEEGAGATVSTHYQYDLLGRLVRSTRTDGTFVEYAYDAAGNRKSKTDNHGTLHYLYDDHARLIQAGDTRFEYDQAGRLSTRRDGNQVIRYQWDEANRLVNVTTPDHAITYVYDGDGNRIERRTEAGSRYYAVLPIGLPQVLLETTDKDTARYLLEPGNSPLAKTVNGKPVYYLGDHLGSTRVVVDEQGSVVAENDYDPFGEPQGIFPAEDYGFADERWDPDAKLLYLRSRYYDPTVGRFVSEDTWPGALTEPQSLNRYAYAVNDPVNNIDPTGLAPVPPPPPFYRPYDYTLPQPNNIVSRDLVSPPIASVSSPTWTQRLSQGTIFGTAAGESSANWWSQRYVENGNPLYKLGGLGASLWTPDTWKSTALTLIPPLAERAVIKAAQSGADYILSRGLMNYSRAEPVHLQIAGKYLHFGQGVRGPHIGIGVGQSNKAFFHLRPEYVNIGGAKGIDVPWIPLTVIGYGAYNTARNAIGFLVDSVKSNSGSNWPNGLPPNADSRRNSYFPPPPGGGGVPAVGGVYLDQMAKVIGELGRITGARYDRENGRLVVLGDNGTALPPMNPEYLAAAIRAVYRPSDTEPGMTIDPICPRCDQMVVRFFGHTEKTRLGWVMFEADRLMKGYSIGRDNITRKPVESSVPGYRSITEMGLKDGGGTRGDLWSRFWLVPEAVTARVSSDRAGILFDPVKIRVKTETMRWSGGKLVCAGNVKDPHAEAFAAHLTGHYDDYAREHPIFAELKQVAQAVALVKWMRAQGIAPDWGFVQTYARPYATPETTPIAVNQLQRSTGRGTMIVASLGGVELQPQLVPTADVAMDPLVHRVDQARIEAESKHQAHFEVIADNKTYTALSIPTTPPPALGSYRLAVRDLRTSASGSLPGLVRHYDSTHNEPSEFGHGWSLLLPRLEFEAVGEEGKQQVVSIEGGNPVRLQRFTLIDRFGLTNTRFARHFVDQGLKRVGFAPEEENSPYRGIYPEGEGTYRLIYGNNLQALFDASGKLLAYVTEADKLLYHYDEADSLKRIESQHAGQTEAVDFEYDTMGRISAVTAPDGRVGYRYDDGGNLAEVKVGDETTIYGYDDRHLLTRISEKGKVTAVKYDAEGHWLEQKGPDGAPIRQVVEQTGSGRSFEIETGDTRISQHYDAKDRLVRVKDHEGARINYVYDADRLASIEATNQFGEQSRVTLSSKGQPTEVVDTTATKTGYHYNQSGVLDTVTVNDRTLANLQFDPAGERLLGVEHRGGFQERWGYDEKGEVFQYARYLPGGSGPDLIEWKPDNDAQALQISHTDPRGQASTIKVPLPTETQNVKEDLKWDDNSLTYRAPDGGESRIEFSGEGVVQSVADPSGGTTSYRYDGEQRLTQIALPNGLCRTWAYEDATETTTSVEHPLGPCAKD